MEQPKQADPTIRFGVFEVDPRSGELRKAGSRIRVQEQPFKVLLALLERPGEVVTREELRHRIWPTDSFGDFDHAVNVAIAKLRTALGDSADIPRYIETLHRRGYRFVFPLTPPNGDEIDPPALQGSTLAGQSLMADTERRTYRNVWVSIGMLAAAIVAGFWLFHRVVKNSPAGAREMEIKKVTNQGNVAYVAISPDGRHMVYALRDKGGLGLWTRQLGTRSDVQVLPSGGEDFRGITFSPDGTFIFFPHCIKIGRCDLYSMPVLGGTPRLLIKDVDAPIGFSPDGRQFMFVRADSKRNVVEVRLANSDGGSERLLTTIDHAGATWQGGGSWSPDGRTLAVAVQFRGDKPGGELDTISLADGSRRAIYASPTWEQVGHPQWLPEGDRILVVVQDQVGRGQIWTVSYPRGEPRPLTHDLEDYHPYLDITRDGKTIVANAWTVTSNLFVLPAGDFSRMRQITFEQQEFDSVAVGPDARLLVHENSNAEGELWAMNADGSQRVLLSPLRDTGFAGSCGRFVTFTTTNGRLIRTDADGLNPTELVSAHVWSPSCATDGRFVFYADNVGEPEWIMRIPIEGGAPTEIAKTSGERLIGPVVVSPDGKFLAYPSHDLQRKPSVILVIVRSEDGAPVKTFPGIYAYVRWSPDGRAVDYFSVRDGVVQIMEQALSGGQPRELTRFASGRTYGFNWSPDGKQLYVPHGEVRSDAVLISDFR